MIYFTFLIRNISYVNIEYIYCTEKDNTILYIFMIKLTNMKIEI